MLSNRAQNIPNVSNFYVEETSILSDLKTQKIAIFDILMTWTPGVNRIT